MRNTNSLNLGPSNKLVVSSLLLLQTLIATALPQSCVIAAAPQVVKISAKRFTYMPKQITVKNNVPVVLQLTTLDRSHGFCLPAFNLRTDVDPGKVTELKFTPTKTGDFVFYCDVECGDGHDSMEGKMKVVD